MFNNRNLKLLIFFAILFLLLAIRIFYLQLLEGGSLSRAASLQRITRSEIQKPRGDITDRNGIPFTNRSKEVFIALKPLFLRDKEKELQEICGILGTDYDRVKKEIEIKKEPLLIETDEARKEAVLGMKLEGISAINSLRRYDGNAVAKHVLGYLSRLDQIGESGLEKSYEEALRVYNKSTIGVVTDARNNVVEGLGYRLSRQNSGMKKLNLRLTLDYHFQKTVESVMEKNHITGAVVVENVNNGDILALASKPDYNQASIEQYLYSDKKELFNRAVASYNIGSIFKIIDVAAYLEQGFTGEDFYCPGYMDIGDKTYRCSSYEKGGHGYLDFQEAFSLSCNPYFIKMGISLGTGKILDMAAKFGLGEPVGIIGQGVDEAKGNIPDIKKHFTDGDTANISIGQGEIMATPLQIADMVAAVANGGIKNKVNIVDAIIDEEGNKVRSLRTKSGTRVVSRDTAEKLKELMEAVTESGTGEKAGLVGFGGSGGKTGSAETGQLYNGEKVVHAWFAGYFPKISPKYSIAVFIENGKNGGQAAAPIFEEIAEEIVKMGY